MIDIYPSKEDIINKNLIRTTAFMNSSLGVIKIWGMNLPSQHVSKANIYTYELELNFHSQT
jgi:hypothetical protein